MHNNLCYSCEGGWSCHCVCFVCGSKFVGLPMNRKRLSFNLVWALTVASLHTLPLLFTWFTHDVQIPVCPRLTQTFHIIFPVSQLSFQDFCCAVLPVKSYHHKMPKHLILSVNSSLIKRLRASPALWMSGKEKKSQNAQKFSSKRRENLSKHFVRNIILMERNYLGVIALDIRSQGSILRTELRIILQGMSCIV